MSFLLVSLLVSVLACSALAGPAVLPGLLSSNAVGVQGRVLAVQEPPRPFEYGYEFGDGFGMTQHRREVADGNGNVKGTYGYTDPIGLYRRVEYTAGINGYNAIVRTNEPGTANQATGDAVYIVELPPPAAIAQGIRAAVPIVSA